MCESKNRRHAKEPRCSEAGEKGRSEIRRHRPAKDITPTVLVFKTARCPSVVLNGQEIETAMEQLMKIVNSPFVLLVTGAIVSGLFVQYITSRWQQRHWIFQQSFTAARAKFDKELDQRYRALEGVNQAVSAILTYSQLVIVGYVKRVHSKQWEEQKRAYNKAVIEWERAFSTWGIRLRTFFTDTELPAVWSTIKDERDHLDRRIYCLTERDEGTPEDNLKLVEQISNLTVDLSQRMLKEINGMKQSNLAD
jgi:hypothetical protein